MALLTLGDFVFAAFEIPERIGFGGRQQLAVHKLIGGARLIDAVGPDDASIKWAGVFTGNDASDRARELDAMRVAGVQLPLYWDAFCYIVVIEKLSFQFSNPWWVPYQISCVVVQDLAEAIEEATPTLVDSLLGDLSVAGLYVDTTSAIQSITATNALVAGTTQYVAATGALQASSASVTQTIAGCQSGLNSPDLATVVSTSGSLAQLYAANAYLMRAQVNLDNAST